ncbi:hypothetical protein C2S51_007585 [Perilla frutescens var. frutescens]|nr:hypothetical protein C2S51_007585 [Perilla frutescens var. frutescens]
MTRSSADKELVFDPEPERTLHRLRKNIKESTKTLEADQHLNMANNENPPNPQDLAAGRALLNANMANPEPLIREIGRLRSDRPICIMLPPIANNAEIRPAFIQVLPKFGDLPGESAHKHLSEFDLVCSTLRPTGFTANNLRLLTFSHTLQGKARDWLFDLPPESITTWVELEGQFLCKFFPESRAVNLRMAISSIKQKPNESLAEKSVDAASGGSLTNKTLGEAKQLIIDMASGGQQYEEEDDSRHRPIRALGRAEESGVNEKIDALTSLVRSLTVVQTRPNRCGVCSENGHFTDECPNLHEHSTEQAYYGSGFQHELVFPQENIINLAHQDTVLMHTARELISPIPQANQPKNQQKNPTPKPCTPNHSSGFEKGVAADYEEDFEDEKYSYSSTYEDDSDEDFLPPIVPADLLSLESDLASSDDSSSEDSLMLEQVGEQRVLILIDRLGTK